MGNHEGYKKISLDFSFAKIEAEGEFIQGKYIGVHKILVDGDEKDYIEIQINDTDSKGLAMNKSLQEGFTRVPQGSNVIVELAELMPSKHGQPFKRYEVFIAENELAAF